MDYREKGPAEVHHKAEGYQGKTQIDPGHGTVKGDGTFTPPPVPTGKGTGKVTSVDTPSMDLFATNMTLLVDPVKQAIAKLQTVGVQPGAFYHANQMRIKVNGINQDDGLKKAYLSVLNDLTEGLSDISDGMRTLSQKYKSVEDANKMTATELGTAMESSQSDFGKLMKDNGGTSGAAGTGS